MKTSPPGEEAASAAFRARRRGYAAPTPTPSDERPTAKEAIDPTAIQVILASTAREPAARRRIPTDRSSKGTALPNHFEASSSASETGEARTSHTAFPSHETAGKLNRVAT